MAVSVIPLLGSMMLKGGQTDEDVDPYAGTVFRTYRRVLEACVSRRRITLGVVGILFVLSLWGFGYVDQSFFPDSTRAQFYVEYWRAEGTHITDTARDVGEIDEWIRTLDHVTSTASFSGQGSLRFLLTFSPEDVNSAYGLIMVSVDDWRLIDELRPRLRSTSPPITRRPRVGPRSLSWVPERVPRWRLSLLVRNDESFASWWNRPRTSCGTIRWR